MKIEKEIIRALIESALCELYDKDDFLIKGKAHERSIVFRFGLYLCELMKKDPCLAGYDLDVEYNRDYKGDKKTIGNNVSSKDDKKGKGVFPDLIIHKRESRVDNLLVLEFKTKWSENNQGKDEGRINEFMKGKFEYKFGSAIMLYETLKDTIRKLEVLSSF